MKKGVAASSLATAETMAYPFRASMAVFRRLSAREELGVLAMAQTLAGELADRAGRFADDKAIAAVAENAAVLTAALMQPDLGGRAAVDVLNLDDIAALARLYDELCGGVVEYGEREGANGQD